MELVVQALAAAAALLAVFFLSTLYLSPAATARRLRNAGFRGPTPSFPLGNLREIASSLASNNDTDESNTKGGDIHAAVFPYFARWRRAFGKVFVYWLGTEPFLYVADPEFLKAATAGALGKLWGKPDVFRRDRMPMFGRGLVMAEGDEWARHRHIIAPAFSATNLNDMIGVMEETTAKMLGEWGDMVAAGQSCVDVEKGVVRNAAEIIARASFGISADDDDATGARVFHKLQAMQAMLFRSTRLVGDPRHLRGVEAGAGDRRAPARHHRVAASPAAAAGGRRRTTCCSCCWEGTRRARGRERKLTTRELVDECKTFFFSDTSDSGPLPMPTRPKELSMLPRFSVPHPKATPRTAASVPSVNVSAERKLTTRELVDECKTFFFGGHETTALALSWTLLMLAAHPEWQAAVREEVVEVAGRSGPLDAAALGKLTKMGCVLSEVLRLYPPSPNVQRQALQDVVVVAGDGEKKVVIPKGTNMWIDVVAMHRDGELWGEEASEFRPERFMREGVQGGCRHRMGYVPFGFGGRICVGRNLTAMELRVVLAMVLRRFAVEVAPEYRHAPRIMLSLRPSHGIQLRLTPLC
uniref:Cytochrome P450 n=1 Tax=Oryza barthii TaxID=65489 RepID=A0A0D3FCA2_9ORYZ